MAVQFMKGLQLDKDTWKKLNRYFSNFVIQSNGDSEFRKIMRREV